MSALSNLQKKLEQEAQGIMFPFSASAANVSTTQNVYDSATDGIMTMQGKKYVGPDAVIQYGTEEQDFQRQLKQIEAPMLPQFDSTQFPQAGEGIMQTPTPAPAPPTTPVEPEAPAIDPCPPGFKFDPVKKVCVPIEQPQDKDDKPDAAGKLDFRRNIGPTAKGLGQAVKALNKIKFQENPANYNKDVNVRISNDIPLLALIPVVGNPLRLYLKNQADKDLASLDVADGITVTKNADGSNQLNISDGVGKRSFGQLQTKESLAGNIASTQKKTALGTIEKAPNGQNMIVGPVTLDYFGKGNLFQPTTRTPAETDALNQDEKNKLIEELNAALGITTPEPVAPAPVAVDPESANITGQGGDFGELVTIPKINSQTEEFVGTVNSRLMKDTGTSLKLASILMEIKETGRELANPVTRDMAQEKLKGQEEDAFNAFNQSIEEDRKKGGDYANNLTKSQADYLNSNDRKALPGESKGSNGYLAGARQKNEPTKENSGYGFKATQANYKKSTNTFDQRFK